METHNLTLDSLISNIYQKGIKSQKNFLKEIVYSLLVKAGYKFDFMPTPIEKIPNILGIKVVISEKIMTEAELRWTEKGWIIKISPEQTTHFSGETGYTERGRFSLAHEIAHFLLIYISKKFPYLAESYNINVSQNNRKNYEKLCNYISAELLAPAYLFQNSSSIQHFKKRFNTHRALLEIKVLESLQKILITSRFVIIQQLHHTKILEESESGIIISFFDVNRNTGRTPALRVRYRALPRWGFIPENIKLSRIGLSSAIGVFHDFGYGIPRAWSGKIKVQEKNKDSGKEGKWMSKILESYGQHASYPYGEQGRYLITTLHWPHP
jgi:hypothetical protein